MGRDVHGVAAAGLTLLGLTRPDPAAAPPILRRSGSRRPRSRSCPVPAPFRPRSRSAELQAYGCSNNAIRMPITSPNRAVATAAGAPPGSFYRRGSRFLPPQRGGVRHLRRRPSHRAQFLPPTGAVSTATAFRGAVSTAAWPPTAARAEKHARGRSCFSRHVRGLPPAGCSFSRRREAADAKRATRSPRREPLGEEGRPDVRIG